MHIETPEGRAPNRALVFSSLSIIVVIWAVNFIVAKIGVRYLPALTLGSLRVVFAGLTMLPAYLLFSRRISSEHRPPFRGFTLGDIWTFAYLGFFGVVVNQMCFTIGLRYTSVSHAAVIVGLGPIYTLILAIVFRVEHATWRKVSGMAIAFAGVAVLASASGISAHSASLAGDLITMTGSLGFATYVVLGKRVAGKYDALTMTAFNHFAGAILLIPLALRQAHELASAGRWRQVPLQGWAALLYMAVFSSALAYLLYFWLLRYLEASQLAAFIYLLPVLAIVLGIAWLGERGSWLELAGAVLALGGVYWVESGRES